MSTSARVFSPTREHGVSRSRAILVANRLRRGAKIGCRCNLRTLNKASLYKLLIIVKTINPRFKHKADRTEPLETEIKGDEN